MALNQRIIISARDRASGVFGNVAKNSAKSSRGILGINSALQTTNSSLLELNSTAGLLATGGLATLIFGLRSFTSDALNVKIDVDRIKNTLEGVTGSAEGAAEEFKFLGDESNRLGIELRPVAQSYSRLLASNNLLGIGLSDTREIFTSFSEALIAFGGTRQQSIRVFSALEQIAAKGVVSMEELRQQLGEALPGALALGAKAVNLTVEEFTKLVAQGKIASKDFLLPFARAVRAQFGGTAVKGAQLLVAEFNRTINVLDRIKVAFLENEGPAGGFADSIGRILKRFADFAGTEDFLERVSAFGTVLGQTLEGVVNITSQLVRVLQPLSNTLTSISEVFDKNILGAVAFAVALKGIATAAGLANRVLSRGAVSEVIGSTSGRPVSPRFGPGTLRSRASTGVGATRASAATRAFISSPQNQFQNRISLDRVQTQVNTFGSTLRTKVIPRITRLGSVIGRSISGFVGLVGPLNLLIIGATAAAAALANIQETARIRGGAQASEEASDAANRIRNRIQDELKEIAASELNFASDPELIRAQNRRVQGLLKTVEAQSKLDKELDKFSGRTLVQFERQIRQIRDVISRQLIQDPEAAARDLQNRRNQQIQSFQEARNLSQNEADFFERIRNGLGVSTKLFNDSLIKFAKDLAAGGALDVEGIVETLRPEALKKQAEIREKTLGLETQKNTLLQQELTFIQNNGMERLAEFKLLKDFQKKINEGLLTQDQAQKLLNERVTALRQINRVKALRAAEQGVDAQERELSFLQKNGESQIFRFRIQEKYAEQVRKGLLTQEKANSLQERELSVARQRLLLQENNLSALSAITAESAAFGQNRAQAFLDRQQSQRRAQLQENPEVKRQQVANNASKKREEADRKKLIQEVTGLRTDLQNARQMEPIFRTV